jgi:hypothetical protein
VPTTSEWQRAYAAHKDGLSETPAWESPLAFSDFPQPGFPTECLPPTFASFISGLAEFTQTPEALAAMLILGVCGAALAKKFRVVARPGWTEPTNLYIVVALPPGNRKSAVFADVFSPVKELERQEAERMVPRIAEKASAKRTLEQRLSNTEKEAARAKDAGERAKLADDAKQLARELAQCEVPAPPQFIADDVTVEKLGKLMAEHDERMLIASTEGTIFEIAKGRYSESPNFDILLKGHAGDRTRSDRLCRGSDDLEQPAISLATTTQPDAIAGLMGQATMRGRGFLARLLYALPRSLVGNRRIRTEAVTAEVMNNYREKILSLWRIHGAVTEKGKPIAHFLRFSLEADKALEEFECSIEPQLGEGGDLEYLADWASKLAGAVVRIAGILHAMEGVDTVRATFDAETGNWPGPPSLFGPIGAKTVEAAVCIAEDFLIPHAKAAFGLMGADTNPENAKRLLNWMTKGNRKTFTRRDAQRAIPNRIRKAEDLEPILGLLLAHGYIRAQSTANGGKPGRKASPAYDVNPAVLEKKTP